MKIPEFRRFNHSDYPEFNTPDGERFFQQLNDVLEPICMALAGRIGPDNLNCEIKEFEVEEDTEYVINLQRIKGPLRSVSVLRSDLFDYAQVTWWPVSSLEYKIKISFDSAPTSKTLVRLLFEGE